MLRSVCLTAFCKNQIDSCVATARRRNQFSLLIATVAISLMPSVVSGQATETAEQPKPAAESTAQETDQAKVAPEKMPEAKVKLKKLTVDLRGRELAFEAPESWKAKNPRINFIKHELMLPKAEGDEKDARMTLSLSSGSTQDNINRWKKQFKFPPGANPDKQFSVEKQTVDGYELSLVQIRGTFLEKMGGPFAGGKTTSRENYMMKAVIISSKDADARTPKCFIKLVGSEKTIKQHTKAYAAMVKSLKTQAAID